MSVRETGPASSLEAREPLVRIVEEPIDASAVVAAVAGPDAGAVAVFLGTVRETAHVPAVAADAAGAAGAEGAGASAGAAACPAGRRVLFLEYEAYTPMAEKEMLAIALALPHDVGPCRVAILHRTGRLELGEVSVAIAVASAHRRIALEACAEAIERVKKTVPIWKKEHFEGGAIWIEGDPSAPEGRLQHPPRDPA
jgi:molybdopterin synthase catalytic subunit